MAAFSRSGASARTGLFERVGLRYEVACDVMGAMISHYAQAIAQESDKPAPHARVLALYEALESQIRQQRDSLDHQDSAAIEAAIAHYGPRARAAFAPVEDATQQLRREQFVQVNASCALDGLIMDEVDFALQEQLSIGTICADEAVALLHQLYTGGLSSQA